MDVESIIHAVLRELVLRHGFRAPMRVATVASNGASILTRIDAAPPGSPPGSITQEHVAGDVDEEGFAAPLHLMVVDATGRVRVAIASGHGPPRVHELAEVE